MKQPARQRPSPLVAGRVVVALALLVSSASTVGAEPPAAASPATIPATAPDLAALWHDACLWEVGSNVERVPSARRTLVAQGELALDFLIPSKLDTKDGLVVRALQVVVTGIGSAAVPRLLPALQSDRPNVRRNAADLLGGLGAIDAAPAIAALLGDPEARLGALAALSALKAPSAVPAITALMTSDAPERVRFTAASTLGAIGGDAAITALVARLADRAAPVRFAAQAALETLRATTALRHALKASDQRVRLHALAALARVADPSARDDVRAALDDPSPVVRGFAVAALAPIAEPADGQRLTALGSRETDAFVRGKLDEARAHAAAR